MTGNKKLKLTFFFLPLFIFALFPLKTGATIIAELNLVRADFFDKYSQIEAAGTAMSLATKVFDYYTLVGIKKDFKVEVEPLFDDWADITIILGNQKIKDPVTFYFPKEGNEEEIYFAEVERYGGDAGFPPEPPGGWPPLPPPEPGKLQWPIVNPAVDSRYGCFRTDCGPGYEQKCNCTYLGKPARVHHGIDIFKIRGTPVYAAADGVVFDVGIGGGYGKYVGIKHETLGLSTFYAHLDSQSFSDGDRVKASQPIATVGNTGCLKTDPHLHFEVRLGAPIGIGEPAYRQYINLRSVDPTGYLPPL